MPNLKEDNIKKMIPAITEEAKDLLFKLLNKNMKERINLIDVQLHPWLHLTEDEIFQKQSEIV